ncbi:MAG: 2-hydroxyacyl-CoA dehydratase, partial [Oscillospiraceae bacterium]|nr:2-hydroxyacyl-CoA dehydratase [Oscillospiraceae bacterium]
MADERNYNTRSVKKLEAGKLASAYQKEWFKGLAPRVKAGEPFAIVSAYFPMEIFRAMDIPFVVSQWWSAICAAKQMSGRYFENLRREGYREDLCSYCGTVFAGSLDPEPELGPWGGLPNPTLLIAESSCGSLRKIYELMGRKTGASIYCMERTTCVYTAEKWWELAPYDWEKLYEPGRVDYIEKDLRNLIHFLETQTGRMLDENRLIEIMNIVNEQENYYKMTRDLIAETIPAPVSVTDTVNAVMQAQWQRGTQWAADHAKFLYEEVKARADAGLPAIPNEKIRLMWIGIGLWSNLAFYQHFEEKYGAVFVWTMYLAMAADQYPRYNVEENPLRALASREIGMRDALHVYPMNADWYIHEAEHNHIDGIVYYNSPGGCADSGVSDVQLVIQTLRNAGYPVLDFKANALNGRRWNQEEMINIVETFI